MISANCHIKRSCHEETDPCLLRISTFNGKPYTSVLFSAAFKSPVFMPDTIVVCSAFHIKGIQCKYIWLCSSTTLQVACTVHTCNNAYSTKTSPKLHSIFLWYPEGDCYVTSGSALQSFHHCNCKVSNQTLFSAFQRQFLKPPEVASLQARPNQN